MTPQEHYEEAERLLTEVTTSTNAWEAELTVQKAHVHALLASCYSPAVELTQFVDEMTKTPIDPDILGPSSGAVT